MRGSGSHPIDRHSRLAHTLHAHRERGGLAGRPADAADAGWHTVYAHAPRKSDLVARVHDRDGARVRVANSVSAATEGCHRARLAGLGAARAEGADLRAGSHS